MLYININMITSANNYMEIYSKLFVDSLTHKAVCYSLVLNKIKTHIKNKFKDIQ